MEEEPPPLATGGGEREEDRNKSFSHQLLFPFSRATLGRLLLAVPKEHGWKNSLIRYWYSWGSSRRNSSSKNMKNCELGG